jgi:NTE family protein
MAEHPVQQPKALVLGVGGILGEAWLSATLAGLIETGALDPDRCETLLGTSAGSIVAAGLSAGVDPRTRLEELPEPPPDDEEAASAPRFADAAQVLRRGASLGLAATGALAPFALRATAPGGAFVRRAALSRVPRGSRSLGQLGTEIERIGAEWDGRLRVVVVDLGSGQRVVFGSDGPPEVTVAEAVQASCAIPGVFRPLDVDGHSYVDGGAWSPTNLDAVPVSKGDRVLCLNPTGALRPSRRSPFGAYGPWSRSMAAIESAALRQCGADVSVISPDRESADAMGPNLMSPSRRRRVIAAGLAQGRRLGAGA